MDLESRSTEKNRLKNQILTSAIDYFFNLKYYILKENAITLERKKNLLSKIRYLYDFFKANESSSVNYVNIEIKKLFETELHIEEESLIDSEEMFTSTVKISELGDQLNELINILHLKQDIYTKRVLNNESLSDICIMIPNKYSAETTLNVIREKILAKYDLKDTFNLELKIPIMILKTVQSFSKNLPSTIFVRASSLLKDINSTMVISFDTTYKQLK
ncbi:25.4 kDa protein [Cordyline virus 3]|uniref:25.4 kDa protein n=1 Tax=Cordyline virus 3 TaxID=1177752 RepID=M1PB45_9CLOS|nr:25.4 kDa protein [Cordyline virus 3]AGF73886.1 25.4 kDa protein [Cordyline virus 3]